MHRLQLVLRKPELGDYFVGFSGEAEKKLRSLGRKLASRGRIASADGG